MCDFFCKDYFSAKPFGDREPVSVWPVPRLAAALYRHTAVPALWASSIHKTRVSWAECIICAPENCCKRLSKSGSWCPFQIKICCCTLERQRESPPASLQPPEGGAGSTC